MKRHYYPETDSLYIELMGTGAETREIIEGLVVDLDAAATDWARYRSGFAQA